MFQIALILASVFRAAVSRCPAGSVQGLERDDCYWLSFYTKYWDEAEDDCRSKGGHLPSVSNAFTNAFLWNQSKFWIASEYWLGASEGSSYGSWTWSDGTPFSYTNWGRGEPWNRTNLYIAASTRDGTWFATYGDLMPYFCKLPALPDESGSSSATPIPPETTTQPASATHSPSQRCDSGHGWTYSPVSNECWATNLIGPGQEDMDWQSQMRVCAYYNSTPISIHSEEANQAAAAFILSNPDYPMYQSTMLWLGLHNPGLSGWQWVDNSTFNYTNWAHLGDSDCTFMQSNDCYAAMSIVNETGFGQWYGFRGVWGFDGFGEPIICVKPAYY